MERKYWLFFVFITFTCYLVGVEVKIDPFEDADSYISKRKNDIDEITQYEQKYEEEYEQKSKDQALDEAKINSRKNLISRTENLIEEYKQSYRNYKKGLLAKDMQAQEDAITKGIEFRDNIDTIFDSKEINELVTNIRLATKEIPSANAGTAREQKQSVEEEDIVVERFIEGIIEYLQVVLLAQWFGELYVSLPEFGWKLLATLFGRPPTIDWSPLATPVPEQATLPNQEQDNIQASDALDLLNTLQDYKTYFFILAQDPQITDTQVKAIGDKLNKILYAIENEDPSVALPLLYTVPEKLTTSSFITEIVNILRRSPTFSFLNFGSATNPTPKLVQTTDVLSKSDFLKILKTLQRLEGGFLAFAIDTLSGDSSPSLDRQTAIEQLSDTLNQISMKIENRDINVLEDLKNINQNISSQTQLLQNKLDQDQNFAEEFSAMTRLLQGNE